MIWNLHVVSQASSALRNFRATVRLAESLLSLERRYAEPAPPQSRPLVDGLRAGAAVLMVAAFEDFVRSMVQERLGSLRSRTPLVRFDLLPARLRVASVFTSLEGALKGPAFGPRSGRESRLPTIGRVASDVVAGRVNVDAIASTRGNPGPEVLSEILKHCDISNPFSTIRARFEKRWRASVAENFIRDKLEEIVARRHEVAHTGRPSGSRADLAASLKFLRVLSTVLDDEVRIKVNKVYRTARPRS